MSEKDVGWSDLHLFLAVARAGGLSPAARTTGRSAATLGRRMYALERMLGRELFVRHDRGYEMTPDGRRLMASLTEVEARIVRLTAAPRESERPLVKVSAGTWTTLHLLTRLDEAAFEPILLTQRRDELCRRLDDEVATEVVPFPGSLDRYDGALRSLVLNGPQRHRPPSPARPAGRARRRSAATRRSR